MAKRLLAADNAVLLIIDIQEKFVPVVHESQHLIERTWVMIEAARLLNIPILVSEQYPKGLGHTVKRLKEALPEEAQVLEKSAFGCLGDIVIKDKLTDTGRKQVLVCGLEAHVCVNQTVHQLLDNGFEPHLIEDALASRDIKNKAIGLRKMEASGAVPSCTEMALFELMGHAKHPHFRKLQGLIK
jgi:nicotinamidase-related amidase